MPDRMTNKMSESSERIATWADEDRYWKDNFRSRPYVTADRDYDYYAGAYRYGFESAPRYPGRSFDDAESDLRSGWDRYEHRGRSTWESVKDAVRDAWYRVTH